MKFENDYIRVEIEKKRLTEEQKLVHRNKRRKRLPYMVIALVLVAAITGGSVYYHFKPMEERVKGTYIPEEKLFADIQSKYQNESLYNYTYGVSYENVERSQEIDIQLGFNPQDTGAENWDEICGFFQDADLTQEFYPNMEWNKESATLGITPPTYTINSISTGELTTETVNKYSHSRYGLFDKGSGNDWGNLGTLYMAWYYDQETGEKLDKPRVSIIGLKAELEETPILTYRILEDGRPEFSWTPVEGAEEYLTCRTETSPEKGYRSSLWSLAATSDTKWTTAAPDYGAYSSMNGEFDMCSVSEDDWKNETIYDLYKDENEPGKVILSNQSGEYGICVIAVCKEGSSLMSNNYQFSELAPSLPRSLAMETQEENGFTSEYEKIEEFPIYDYVVMCDGIVNKKLIDYQTENATVSAERFIYTDDDGNYLRGENIQCLNVPYIVEGTPFSYTMRIVEYDEANLEEDMKFLEEREDSIRGKSGELGPEAEGWVSVGEETGTGKKSIRQIKDVEVFANSALSEYLALNMLGGATNIDISQFPEARNTAYVEDALMEAYYQNPLIFGLKSYCIDRQGKIVQLQYDNTPKQQDKKQREVQKKAERVIKEIIQEGMSEEEKEIAINQYLCDTVEYDMDALDNAQESEYAVVDEEFVDAFDAYGALINGKCVCAGYAAAFKILADEAGLESIVVTGLLEGSTPHAWNKVKINNEWQIVDTTNNDNEYFFNALLNIPEKEGERVLVENKKYMLDKKISSYEGKNFEYEYYHITDNFYNKEQVSRRLASGLKENGAITLRTDYSLNDEEFYQITDQVYDLLGSKVTLKGYYWLGVIYLTAND